MSDARLRQLEREALGDPAARVALLRARVRAGTLSQERLELAAYVGDPDARAALGRCCAKHDALERRGLGMTRHYCAEDPLAPWVRGLSRWGAEVLVRAAVAAARCALAVWASGECEDAHSSHPDWQAPLRHLRLVCGNVTRTRRTIETAEAWLACPCDDHWSAWGQACPGGAGLPGWTPAPQGIGWAPDGSTVWIERRCIAAVEAAGEPAVRATIRSALVAWSLGT